MRIKYRKQWMIWLSVAFLAVCFFASCYLSWRTSEYIYDADASSELILAELLNEEGGILSENWYYSTELRVLNTNLIYSPLFSVFSSWRMVRFVGSVILQAILVLSFLFCAKHAGVRLSIRLFAAGLLLLPVSVTHAQMLLMHCYYVPHVAIGFILMGLLFMTLDMKKQLYVRLLCFFAYLLLSFVSGLGGVRQLMVTFLPLLLAGLQLLFSDHEAEGVLQRLDSDFCVPKIELRYLLDTHAGRGLFLILFGSASAGIGYLFNSRILAAKYSFFSFEFTSLGDLSAEHIFLVLTKLLGTFGYRGASSALLISVTGVLAILSVGCCAVAFVFASRMMKKESKPKSYDLSLFGSVFFAGAIVTFLLFIFTQRDAKAMYFIPVYVLAIGSFAAMLENALIDHRRLVRIVILGVSVVMLGNAGLTARYFISNHCGERVPLYSAITYGDYEGHIDDVREIRSAVDYLLDNGYSYGYSDFWNGNLCTEMTEGALRFVNLHIRPDGFEYYNWLMRKDTVEEALAAEKPFLLVSKEDHLMIQDNALISVENPMVPVYMDDFFVIYAKG